MPVGADRWQVYNARYRARHRPDISARAKEQYRRERTTDPGKFQAKGWKGIVNADGTPFSPIDYDRAYQIQFGRCLICRRHSTEFTRRFDVDHDHKTGRFRALLCNRCNLKIGHYEAFKLQGEIYLTGGQ